MEQLVRALTLEEQRLAAELSQDPRFQRWQLVRQLLDLYQGQEGGAGPLGGPLGGQLGGTLAIAGGDGGSSRNVPPEKTRRRRPRAGDQVGRVIEAVDAYLAEKGRRASTNELFTMLQQKGIAVTGRNPLATLSSILSRRPQYDNVRGLGYGIVRWKDHPPGTPTDEDDEDTSDNKRDDADPEQDEGEASEVAA